MSTAVLGMQTPRVSCVPPYSSSAGREAADLAEQAGLHLDPWQRHVLEAGLGEDAAGRWSAFEVGVIVPRQNGKGAILEARELAGLFLFGEELILHSAHEFKTAAEAFRRVLSLVEGCASLRRRVKKVRTSHGEEGIELVTGQRLRFVARSTGSGRGFSGDCVILDEAYNLSNDAMSALLPTLSARPNPQLWYTSSAGMLTSVQLGRVRRRGVEGSSPRLAFFEWSVPDDTPPARFGDRALWAQSNPGLGIRIGEEFVEAERQALDSDSFGRERLGIGEYPVEDGAGWAVIPETAWSGLADVKVKPSDRVGPISVSAETTQDRSFSAIGIAFRTADGVTHVEVDRYGPGATWVVPRLLELRGRYGDEICALVIDKVGAASSFVDDLEEAGEVVVQPSAAEVTEAFGQFYDGCVPDEWTPPTVRHLDQPELNAAVAGAQTRLIGDRRAWDRKAGAFMPPLCAVTLAAWGWSDDGDPLSNIW